MEASPQICSIQSARLASHGTHLMVTITASPVSIYLTALRNFLCMRPCFKTFSRGDSFNSTMIVQSDKMMKENLYEWLIASDYKGGTVPGQFFPDPCYEQEYIRILARC